MNIELLKHYTREAISALICIYRIHAQHGIMLTNWNMIDQLLKCIYRK